MTFDWTIVAEHWPSFVAAAGRTLAVSVLAMLFGLGLGLAIALARLSGSRLLRACARVYVEVVRGTPILVQVFFVYAALPLYGIRLSPFASGVVALSVYAGAYAAEILRAGISAVHRGQVEAARSLGMTRAQTLRRITLPIMGALVVPPLTSEFTGVIKWSAILSIVTVQELTWRATYVINETYSPLEALALAAAFYWALNDLVAYGGRLVERRLTRHLA